MTEAKNNYEEEIKKLTNKIIELQDLIIAKDKEIQMAEKEGREHFLKLSTDCFNKDRAISGLKSEIFEIKALLAKQWSLPLEKAEERLSNEMKSFKKELGLKGWAL